MKTVYLLWHTHVSDGLIEGEDVKLIGVYSTQVLAEEAKERSAILEGFKDSIEDFEISEHELDTDSWSSGFTTV